MAQAYRVAPGLDGFIAAQEQGRAQDAAGLQQGVGLMGLLQALHKQKQEQQYLGALSSLPPDATPEQTISAARPFMGPDALARMTQGSQDRQAQIAATKEVGMARLQQAAQQFENHYQLRLKQSTTADERLILDRQREAFKQSLQTEAARLSGAKANYDFGFLPSAPIAPTVQAPNALRTTAPNDAEALKIVQAAEAAGIPASATVAPQARPVVPTVATQPAASIQPAAPVPTAAVTQPALPPMPPEIAAAPQRVQNQWRLQQSKGSIAGTGQFTPQALEFTAKQYLSGDRQAVQGFARNATARIALQNTIVEEAAKRGMSPEQTASKMAEFAGTIAGSRTVGQRAANISLAATEAQEMLGIVKETSDKFSRTQFVPWNMAVKAWESGTGSPEISEFGAAVNALVNVYARAINPTGVPTVSDKEHARAVINVVQSPAQVNAVLGIINRELEIAKRAPATVREGIRTSITGESQQPKPVARPSGTWSIKPIP